jgi:excisionase family DNA binding protein
MAERAQSSADGLADSPSSRISVLEIARRLNIGRLAVYSMLEQGIIPGVRLGRRGNSDVCASRGGPPLSAPLLRRHFRFGPVAECAHSRPSLSQIARNSSSARIPDHFPMEEGRDESKPNSTELTKNS